ncbi:GNAT family N-acetyltransferase [Saccharopolyspora sp. NFXS83]|uniref:GNAT family N-acetyltransferase n=1 Tax=Saccharopolyspora sp. NFXS83 TaxID=2993560 RepID=UPI00224A60C9|nr:GNAT family N-acetyltransferase [Saccharopolyspora sp. NFXS83]MCX2732297.1 GNAT family N-acetyltransferase [Saccharopolyspora sp. NFXS83]
MHIEIAEFDHPAVQRLIAEVQQEYVARYGRQDETPIGSEQFRTPHGMFLLGRVAGEPVAIGGWRVYDPAEPEFEDGDVELKRMYVAPRARGRGLARRMLTELEERAVAAGHKRVLLETGDRQPEAIGLYRAAGYTDIPAFGPYRDDPASVCFAKTL